MADMKAVATFALLINVMTHNPAFSGLSAATLCYVPILRV